MENSVSKKRERERERQEDQKGGETKTDLEDGREGEVEWKGDI